jgi:hypothetical protein
MIQGTKILAATKTFYQLGYEHGGSMFSILINRMQERDDGRCLADVTIERWTTPVTHIYHARGDLKYPNFKTSLARAIEKKVGLNIQWDAIIEEACMGALMHLRSFVTSQIAEDVPFAKDDLWQLEPFIPYKQPGIIFGFGSAGKTLMVLTMAMSIQSGRALLANTLPRKGNVLFCDWETSDTVISSRLAGLKDGFRIKESIPIRYMFCFRPLYYMIPELSQEIDKYNIDTLIIDNFGAALGGEANDINVSMLFNGVRELGCSTLLLDHRAKGINDARPTPFGSVYKENRARIVWLAENPGTRLSPGEFDVKMSCEKTNISSPYLPMTYNILWLTGDHTDSISVSQMKGY